MSMSSICDDHLVSLHAAGGCMREIRRHPQDRWREMTVLPCAFRWKVQLQVHSGIVPSHYRDRLLRVFRRRCIAPTNELSWEPAAECASDHSPIQTSNPPHQCSIGPISIYIFAKNCRCPGLL